MFFEFLQAAKQYDNTTSQLSLDIQAHQYVPLEQTLLINEACIAQGQEIPLRST